METRREIEATSLDAAHRRALEAIIGAQLQANHRLIINVTDVTGEQVPASAASPVHTLEDWTIVYEGLNDREIEQIDQIAKTRANLARDLG
jgi:hypothetical protein